MAATGSVCGMYREIEACGFFPELVSDCIRQGLGDEQPSHYLVHHEATFDDEGISRHLTVLVLTPSQLLVSHTDENCDDLRQPTAISSIEAVPARLLGASSLTRVVSHPEHYRPGHGQFVETWLTLSWGTMRRAEIEPAHCGDSNCEADHGYDATSFAEDIVVRMSVAADGQEAVDKLAAFGAAFQRVSAGGRQ